MKSISHTFRFGTSAMLAMVLGSYLYTTSADAAGVENISRVMGGIRVQAQEQVGDISSVNGGIDLGRGANARDVETVNGGIELSAEVVIDQAETVNGGIEVANDVTVNGSLHTVNGGIEIGRGTTIQDNVETVNGRVRLRNTHVGNNVKTVNGDIILRDGTVVEGDLIIGARRSWLRRWFHFGDGRSNVIIDGTSSVMGDIHLYEEVDLQIDNNAEVGDVIEHY